MGTCKVFDWTRAVLSSEYLSSIPSNVDHLTFFKKIADRLTLVTDQKETNGHPAFQGHWINIVKAEVILKELVTKWKDSRQESTAQKNVVTSGDASDHTSVLVEIVPDIDFNGREITDNLLNKFSKENVEETVISKLKNGTDHSRVYMLTDNLKNLYSGNGAKVVSENIEKKDATKQTVVPLLDSTCEEKNKYSDEIQAEELQELYMNITVSPFKEYSKKKDEEKLIWDETDKETGENPLNRLCQLLRIDEEESKDKRCLESDRKRKYEDNLPFKYFCSHCSFKSKRKNHFLKHCQLHDKPQKLYMCGQCDFKTIRISTLRRHELVHSEDKLLLCDLCPYKTDDPKFLAKHHSLKHSGNKLIKCNQCDYSSGSQREFRKHALTHKPNKPTTVWNCDQCSYKSRLKAHLQRHINDVHSSQRPFLCHYCGKCFKRHDTLKQHKITHGEISAVHTCDQCGKVSTCASQLKEHMSVHTVLRPYLCDQCGASFKTKSNQRKHIKTLHSAEAPFPCTQCKQTFKSKPNLLRHLRTHRSKADPAAIQEIAPKLIMPNIAVDPANFTAGDTTTPVTIQVVYCNIDGDKPDLVFQ